MTVKVINTSTNELPQYQTEHSAGMDLKAFLAEPIIIKPMQRVLVTTGLYIELPDGYEAQIRPRSGLALKHGITVLNSPGTIDADYRGEIKVLLVNFGTEDFTINNGERIAQMIISNYTKINWQQSSQLTQTERGAGGYGSTGK
ncbi:MAG: dUTP diphosphatase [Bacteroidia bacterium]